MMRRKAAEEARTQRSEAKPAKRRGRPKGSRSRPADHIRHHPPRCQRCKSTCLEVLRKIGEMKHAGTSPDGAPYDTIVRRRVRCLSCGQVSIITEYLNAGDES